MKKTSAALGLLVLTAALCFAGGKKDVTEVTVFAAASMTEAMNEIKGLYEKKHPGIRIVYNFDSSGTLKTQIDAGAPADLFISAGKKQMDQLEEKNTLAAGTRWNIVSNSVVLIVPQGSTKGISTFADLAGDKVKLASLGNSDVPVGQYSEEIYRNLKLWDVIQKSGKITWGSNVKEVLSHVSSGAVDCGVVYSTDAATAKGVTVVASAPPGSHQPITYPAALLAAAPNPEAAADFVAFLKGPESRRVFEGIGFVIPQ